MRRYLFFSTAMVIALACTAKLQAQFPFEPAGAERSAEDLVSVRAFSSIDVVHPGESFLVAVDFTIEPGWHIYWINPGSSGMPTRVSMKGPPGFGVQPLRFTRPTMIQEPEGLTFGYEKRAVLFVPVTAPDQLPGGEAAFELSIGFLVCKEVCLMGSQTLALVIPTSTAAPVSVEPRSLPGGDQALLSVHRARLPRPLTELADVQWSFDGATLTMSGAAGGHEDVLLFPIEGPAVTFGAVHSQVKDDRFTLHAEVDVRPGNAPGRPIRLQGLIALGRELDGPCYEFDLPLLERSSPEGAAVLPSESDQTEMENRP